MYQDVQGAGAEQEETQYSITRKVSSYLSFLAAV